MYHSHGYLKNVLNVSLTGLRVILAIARITQLHSRALLIGTSRWISYLFHIKLTKMASTIKILGTKKKLKSQTLNRSISKFIKYQSKSSNEYCSKR